MVFNGIHALVTGGGSGIGLAIASALAAEGATVTITGRRLDVLQKAAEADTGRLDPVQMDVTDEAQTVDAIAGAVDRHGPVKICVANAGIAEGRSLAKTDMEFWRRIMATNLDGAMVTIRESLKSMRQADWGRVIAVSSIAGVRGLKGAPAYTASKHGMIGLVRGLSEDFLGSPITFNAICPGYVDTDIVTRNVTSISERAGISADAARDIMISANRHNRLIAPQEVARAALWLCHPEAASVNGQCIEISGGQT
ncbi:SDR family NAD(P)-dependent oxidoreductase [Pseudaestuariivita atlantica]|uniref:3-hydroxyacyl-CoA dehydrogenase n=1 Tax=Pseudaestuariivita atlantica TaxID=1317121 RepID=A0A0L1JQH3_9RHOB|nr:SDR family oxidoreductase [Pseudaestuariivita atlantica]KNG93980.1 3-hydroxyacyl-CoA dehydrogenase [Pseudaestuariivita atlantica]